MSKNTKVESKVEEVSAEIDLSAYPTTSSKIRHLNSIGFDRSKIAKHLGIRYQHVRNVLITPIKKEATK